MSYLKFSSNLFLETVELNRMKRFFDQDGFRKNILDSTVNFGLIKNNFDISFQNGLVQQDQNLVQNGNTYQTVKINPIRAIDLNGNFIYSAVQNQIPIPNDGNWYWVKCSYQISNLELGTFAIDSLGNLTGTGNEDLTTLLRGFPNFPTKVRFLNSINNTFDYSVLQVVNSNTAQLLGTNFQPETGLQMAIVGTFTPGIAVPPSSQLIFNYDSCTTSLIVESSLNVRPSSGFVQGRDFYIARVQVSNNTLVIQDKRVDYWETKASAELISIDSEANPLIGIESVQFDNTFATSENSLVNVSWGMRSNNWTINTNTNIVTLFGNATGGIFKDPSYVTDDALTDFIGWRIYTENGNYCNVISATKSGLNINLNVDVLDPDNFVQYSNGTSVPIPSFTGNGNYQTLFLCPNAEEIELTFTPSNGVTNSTEVFSFPINQQVANCHVLVNGSPATYGITYKYRTNKTYSPNYTFPADPVGYYNEASFDANGKILPTATRVPYDTAANPNNFLVLQLNPHSYTTFKNRIDKGDIKGVNRTHLSNSNPTPVIVAGVDKQYQFFSGSITLNADISINLRGTGIAIEGNEFIIHFDNTLLNLNGKNLSIFQDYLNISNPGTLLKKITQGDCWTIMNSDKGGYLHFIFDGTTWLVNQSWTIPTGAPIGMYDNVSYSDFDWTGTRMGITQGYFGYSICDGSNGTPDLRNQFILGGAAGGLSIGNTGGEANHTLIPAELPPHTHRVSSDATALTNSGSVHGVHDPYSSANPIQIHTSDGSSDGLNGSAHNNMPPYYVLAFVKRLF